MGDTQQDVAAQGGGWETRRELQSRHESLDGGTVCVIIAARGSEKSKHANPRYACGEVRRSLCSARLPRTRLNPQVDRDRQREEKELVRILSHDCWNRQRLDGIDGLRSLLNIFDGGLPEGSWCAGQHAGVLFDHVACTVSPELLHQVLVEPWMLLGAFKYGKIAPVLRLAAAIASSSVA